MKKVFLGLIFLYLFFYFLVYCGVFRNNSDPVKVAKFYFECMKNYEWMLTYPITKTGYFEAKDLVNNTQKIFFRANIKPAEFKLLGIKENTATVETKFICEDQQVIKSVAILERNNQKKWLIKEVSYY